MAGHAISRSPEKVKRSIGYMSQRFSLDMDLPVDAADAFILTTAERARDLPHVPVVISHAVQGLCETASDEDQLASLAHHGQDVVVRQLREQGACGLADFNDTDIAMIAARRLSGMLTAATIVDRMFSRKRKITSTAKAAPSPPSRSSESIESMMKVEEFVTIDVSTLPECADLNSSSTAIAS